MRYIKLKPGGSLGVAVTAGLFGTYLISKIRKPPIKELSAATVSSPERDEYQRDIRTPGEELGVKQKAGGLLSSAAQSFKPLHQVQTYFNTIRFLNGDPRRQVCVHGFCTHLNKEFAQCMLYDGNEKDSKLIGVEYIISRRLYESLPPEERKLWHSHVYDVKSGLMVAPPHPDTTENALMKDLVDTYGKTFHLWQVDRGDDLPYGIPQLMMSATDDKLLDDKLVALRDKELGVDVTKKRKSRENIETPNPHHDADAWKNGEVYQVKLTRL